MAYYCFNGLNQVVFEGNFKDNYGDTLLNTKK